MKMEPDQQQNFGLVVPPTTLELLQPLSLFAEMKWAAVPAAESRRHSEVERSSLRLVPYSIESPGDAFALLGWGFVCNI